MNNQPIGFIDSGVGGLSVVKEVMKRLPNENIIFIGDSARNPYGNRTMEEVLQFSKELTHYLMKKKIKMLVIACNTATVAALDVLQSELPIPVIGMIESGSKAAVEQTKNHKIGVIGTKGTINSGNHQKHINALDPLATVYSLAAPMSVEMVENNQFKGEYAKRVIQEELKDLKNIEMDTLLLGCTHYPLLEPLIQQYFGEQVILIDPSIETAKSIQKHLDENQLLNTNDTEKAKSIFYTTGSLEKFEDIARKWIPAANFVVKNLALKELIDENE